MDRDTRDAITALIVIIFLILFVWFGVGVSQRENERLNNPTFDTVNIRYEVKDVFRGYTGTRGYTLVEYYYGDTVLTINDRYRETTITVKRANISKPYMVLYATGTHTNYKKYRVYVPYDSNSEGIDTDIPYRGKGTRPYTTTLDREVTQ